LNKKVLLYEVIDYFIAYGTFDTIVILDDIANIESGLRDPAYVEGLIYEVMKRGHKIIGSKEAKALYLKLSELRFDLEYKKQKRKGKLIR